MDVVCLLASVDTREFIKHIRLQSYSGDEPVNILAGTVIVSFDDAMPVSMEVHQEHTNKIVQTCVCSRRGFLVDGEYILKQ
jgi:hypothetical protein